jgi:hypothetical protein
VRSRTLPLWLVTRPSSDGWITRAITEPTPTCFIIMPFGMKLDAAGRQIDFDAIYRDLIREPLSSLGLSPLRSDEIEKPGSIDRDMFTQIATAPFAVVDITTLNPNVFYELGARHALRRNVTLVIRHRDVAPAPFNIGGLRVLQYPSESGSLAESGEAIRRFLEAAIRETSTDSPIEAAGRLIDAVESYLANTPESVVEEVYIAAWNRRDLDACTQALESRAILIDAS